MTIKLQHQITAALVLFGLLPAAIVAFFTFRSTEEFKDKQKAMIRQAAGAVSNRIEILLDRQHFAPSALSEEVPKKPEPPTPPLPSEFPYMVQLVKLILPTL